jgi:hypothetical protein
MSQRPSGYEREAFDKYQTPRWATNCLVPHIPGCVERIWEPACGDGHMVRALEDAGFGVEATDIYNPCDHSAGIDFLDFDWSEPIPFDAIITNPPYDVGPEFCERSLQYFGRGCTFVAMLLRVDFDSAKTRRHLFADNPYFSKKIVLLDRIRWEGIEQHTASPSYNHAWYCWDLHYIGPATIAYAHREKPVKAVQASLDFSEVPAW